MSLRTSIGQLSSKIFGSDKQSESLIDGNDLLSTSALSKESIGDSIPAHKSSTLSIKSEYVTHQIDQLEEKKKQLTNELIALHVQIINTKKEYILYHKSLVKLRKTIDFVRNTEEHLAIEKAELNELRVLLNEQRRASLSIAVELPAREKSVEHREFLVSSREKDLLSREAIICAREEELMDKEKFLSDQSVQIGQTRSVTLSNAVSTKMYETDLKQKLAYTTQKEKELRTLSDSLNKQSERLTAREREIYLLAANFDAHKIQFVAQKAAFESQRAQISQYAKQLQHQSSIVESKAIELGQKESRLLIDSAQVSQYQVAASHVTSLQNTREQLLKEIESLQVQIKSSRDDSGRSRFQLISPKY